jgi:hypothetical protein
MTTNRRTNNATDLDDESREPFTLLEAEEVRPERSRPTRVYFYPLPNYETDRRFDVRSRDHESAIMLPYADGYLERFKATAQPGWYFVEMRDKQVILGGDVYQVKPTGRTLYDGQRERPRERPRADASPGASHIVEAVRAVRELRDELEPQGAGLTRDDVREMLAEAVKEQERPVESDPNAQLMKTVATLKTLGVIPDKQQLKEAGAELDEESRASLWMLKQTGAVKEMLKGIREAVTTPERLDQQDSFTDKALGFLKDLAPHLMPLITPGIAKKLYGDAGAATAYQPQPAPTGQPQPAQMPATATSAEQQQPASNPLIPLLRVLVDDCTSDANAARAADAINSLLSARPEFAPIVAQLFSTSSAELVETLAQMSGAHYLPKLPHSIRFCDELKAELRARAEQADEQGSDESEEDATAPPLQVNNDFSTEESVQAS